jgi:hypothetical protein
MFLAGLSRGRSVVVRCPNRHDSRIPRVATCSPPKRLLPYCGLRLPGCMQRRGSIASRTFGSVAMSAIGATRSPSGWISLNVDLRACQPIDCV